MPPRSSLPLLIGAVLLFGLLTFLFGMVVGANLVAGPEAVPVTKPVGTSAAPSAVLPTAALPTGPTLSLPAAVPPVALAAAVPAAAANAPPPPSSSPASVEATPPSAAPPAPASPVPAAQAATESPAPAAIKPLKVKGFGFGEPPSAPPTSSLRGSLLEQAANAPPPAALPLAADSGQLASQTTAPIPAAPIPAAPIPAALAASAAKDASPPMVYSVAVGRFLTEARAGAVSSQAAAKGFTPLVVVADPPDPTGWLTVTLGPQEDAIQAQRLAKEAESQGFDTWMVSWLPP